MAIGLRFLSKQYDSNKLVIYQNVTFTARNILRKSNRLNDCSNEFTTDKITPSHSLLQLTLTLFLLRWCKALILCVLIFLKFSFSLVKKTIQNVVVKYAVKRRGFKLRRFVY